MSKLILMVGVPGSGKSTIAEKMREGDPDNIITVERDRTRSVLFGESYHKGNFPKKSEDEVTRVNDKLIKDGLRAGKTVIVSDTNVNPRNVQGLVRTGRNYGAQIDFEYVNTPADECRRRNDARGKQGGRHVPKFVMDRMIQNAYDMDGNLKNYKIASKTGNVFFVPKVTEGSKLIESFNKKLEFTNPFIDSSVVIVDVDGTLANNQNAAAFYLNHPDNRRKDYSSFFKHIQDAEVNTNVRDLANKMRDNDGLSIVVLTGRSDSYAKELLSFIKRSGIKASRVIAKQEDDSRPDYDFKNDVINELKSEGLVLAHAIDDREGSIQTLEANGIMVSRVIVPSIEIGPGTSSLPPAPVMPEVNTIYGSGYCIRCGQPLKNGGNIGPKCRLK